MPCAHCGATNSLDSRFCEECGRRLGSQCSVCGRTRTADRSFCGGCGTEFEDSSLFRQPPKTYTPEYLAARILEATESIVGAQKLVTVLFADISGSLEVIDDRDPSDTRDILTKALETMRDAAHRFEGFVVDQAGDSILALFGAPLAHEDHALRACYAALCMQQLFREDAAGLRARYGIEIQLRIGLNSGEVIVGLIQSDLRMEYKPTGRVVHVANRVAAAALPGTTRLSPSTHDLTKAFVQVRDLGMVPIRGLHEGTLHLYELLTASPAVNRFQASISAGLTHFVGRDAEVAALGMPLDSVQRGRGQVVALVGQPGVGKSRLAWEFTEPLRASGFCVLRTGGVSHCSMIPYFPIVELLRTYFGLCDSDLQRDSLAKVIGRLLSLTRVLEVTIPAFLFLLGIEDKEGTWSRLDPSQRRDGILYALKTLFIEESRRAPMILVVEDLQWIDSETEAGLAALVDVLLFTPILLLTNHRPEYSGPWKDHQTFMRLPVQPLPTESAAALLDELLGTHVELIELSRKILARSGGNPFFIEQCVRLLMGQGVLTGERGSYRLGAPVADIDVPPTVEAVVAAGVDRLSARSKVVLQSAAVIGHRFDFVLLSAITDLEQSHLRAALSDLATSGFVYESVLFPVQCFCFWNELVQEVVLKQLIRQRRRDLHVRIFHALRRIRAERLDELADQLAYHAYFGEEWEEAVRYSSEAGRKAGTAGAFREAARCWNQMLEAVAHVPETRERSIAALEARFELRAALYPLGEWRQLLDNVLIAKRLAEDIGDQQRLARAEAYLAQYDRVTGRPREALGVASHALLIAIETSDARLQALARLYRGEAYYALGQYASAKICLTEVVDGLTADLRFERFGSPLVYSVAACVRLAWCLSNMGEFTDAEARGEEAKRIAQASDHLPSQFHGVLGLGFAYVYKEQAVRAVPLLEEGYRLYERGNFETWFALIASLLGAAYVGSGRMADGVRLLEDAVKSGEMMGRMEGHGFRVAMLAEAYVKEGKLGVALETANRAIGYAREGSERGSEAYAQCVAGDISLLRYRESTDRAVSYYSDALELAEECGARVVEARALLGLGRLGMKTMSVPEVVGLLERAQSLFQGMRMDGRSEEASKLGREARSLRGGSDRWQ